MKPRHPLSLLLLLLLLACARVDHPLHATLAEADRLRAEGAYTAAEAAYYRAMALAPDDPRPALALADLYRTWGRADVGLTALDAAAQRGATDDALRELRFPLLGMAGQWTTLLTEAKTLAHRSPTDPLALEWLTKAYLHLDECPAAEVTAARWHEVAPHRREARLMRAALRGDAEALCAVDVTYCPLRTLCAQAGEATCTTGIGYRLARAEQWPLAACVLQRAVHLAPDKAVAHAWLGEALRRLGQDDKALRHLREAVRLDSTAPLGWLLLGTALLHRGELSAAREALLHAQRLDPANPAPCLLLADLKARQGRYHEVPIWTDAALQRAPDDPDLWKAVARFYLERNLRLEGYPERAAQGALRLAPEDAEALMLWGWSQLDQGDTIGAHHTLSEALIHQPDLAQAHYLLGLIYLADGETTRARDALTRAADLGYLPALEALASLPTH